MENDFGKKAWNIFIEGIKLFPLLIIVLVLAYALNSSARQTIDGIILQTPARGLVSNQYDIYPRFLNADDVVIKKTVFNDSGKEINGLIIEVRNPAAVAKTPTESMKPMFGPGNLLVQEVVDRNTKIGLGDIVIYQGENDLIIHQIVEEKNGCYVTKGLNNPAPDGVCVTRDMIKYRLLFALPTKNP